jgi:N utilization substance protein A
MRVTLSDEARRLVALFEDETGVAARDCLVDDEFDRVVFVVPAAEMGKAIGPDGQHVKRMERRLDRDVELVEGADHAETFVANALAPAAVYNVTVSENDDRVAYAEVDSADRGVAIGTEGRTIERARELARRHFDIADVELT